ncbi:MULTISPECIES: hypothetical protein [Amycolatopsis]|uniref:Uncharacterized protein n=2 Tax=Amycolatopsis TaxID=1813 RepID=A0A1I4BR25_9PSEU|nr:hypothetical protein [Amycolatopsis sacchari]SFK70291.1 hypothetical protein SAMN05421835_12967 [Amycolatopsis sacchari]
MTTPFTAPPERPLVLLPVRLETRFTDGALRVRVYPDDPHIDRLDPGLDDTERTAAREYWTSVASGGDSDAAFALLATRTKPDRAPWVAKAMTPLNLDDPFSGELRFPDVPPRQGGPVTARGLPAYFVAVVRQGTDTAKAAGRPIPDRLVVAPAAGGTVVRHGDLPLAEGMSWLVDYAEAERVGMAVTVPLPRPAEKVDRLVVFGVREDGQAELERLLTAQRYTAGMAFVPQGTPTNNTETDRSAWQRRQPPAPPPAGVSWAPTPGSDGALLTAALGIDPAVLADVPGAFDRDQDLARAAHTVLWPATWGTFLSELLKVGPSGANITPQQLEAVRDFFQDHVRGAGPLPTLRIGDQPYGLLPVTAVHRFAPDEADPVEPQLNRVLTTIHAFYGDAVAPAVRADSSPETLLDVLGSAPAMLGLRVRSILSQTMNMYATLVDNVPGRVYEQTTSFLDTLYDKLGLVMGNLADAVPGPTTRPLGLPLADGTDADFVAALRQDQPRQVRSVLQALVEIADDVEARAAGTAIPPERFDAVSALLATGPAAAHAPAVTEAFAGRASASELRPLADRLAAESGFAGSSLLAQYQPLEATRTSLADVAVNHPVPDARHQLAIAAAQAWLRASDRRNAFRSALDLVLSADTAQRALLVAQTLDCCSHRIDAGLTALATRRLAVLRSREPRGLALGAYGWVHDIVPSDPAERPGGYIHAPSLAQATTAGVLRAANLAHRASGAFSFDLSSGQVRTGLRLLEGVRQGQQLGALLGYTVERGLHDHPATGGALARFVLSLRALAPLRTGKLTDVGGTPPRADVEAMVVADVVDGVALLTLDRETVIRPALDQGPADNPFLDGWTGPDDGEWAAVNEVLDQALAAYDAVADLLVAEGVHQFASGNSARAAAVMDVVAAGGPPPAEFDVVRTPTRGIPVTHRDLVIAGEPATGASGGWAVGTPRQLVEPRLEQWARTMLGPATAITVGAGGESLDLAGLSALDFVYDAARPGVLERRLRAALPGLGALADPVLTAAEKARSLHRLLAGARPLLPADLTRPGDKAACGIDHGDLRDRVSHALEALSHGEATGFGIDDPAEARRREAKATALLDDDPIAAGEALFGEDFRILPVIQPADDGFQAALGRLNPDRADITRLLFDVATVRDGVARHVEVLMAAGTPDSLRVAQLGTPERWIALPFDPSGPPLDSPVTSFVVDGAPGAGPLAGLVIDEWVETVPRRLPREQGSEALITTGVAVHADAPGARPPQCVLLAVSPDGSPWTADTLAEALNDTLDLARTRLITLERTQVVGRVLPALVTRNASLNGEKGLDAARLVNEIGDPADMIPYVKEVRH